MFSYGSHLIENLVQAAIGLYQPEADCLNSVDSPLAAAGLNESYVKYKREFIFWVYGIL